jgi:hypothetical protein
MMVSCYWHEIKGRLTVPDHGAVDTETIGKKLPPEPILQLWNLQLLTPPALQQARAFYESRRICFRFQNPLGYSWRSKFNNTGVVTHDCRISSLAKNDTWAKK